MRTRSVLCSIAVEMGSLTRAASLEPTDAVFENIQGVLVVHAAGSRTSYPVGEVREGKGYCPWCKSKMLIRLESKSYNRHITDKHKKK